jgi:acetoacetate decarboxylase
MRKPEILKLPSMPLASPSYPYGPFRFIDREYLVITYESDPAAIREAVPEPLEPDGSNTILYEFIRMPDSSGFGNYSESGVVIPAIFHGNEVNFVAQMYLDNEPPISGGREIWGFPKKFATPSLSVVRDTLTGVLEYGSVEVAIGTMAYKHQRIPHPDDLVVSLQKPNINLKIIPAADGTTAIAQLVSYQLTEIALKGAWTGPARLHLVPHVNAPVADLPVRRVMGGLHFIADLTLPYGKTVHDYLA